MTLFFMNNPIVFINHIPIIVPLSRDTLVGSLTYLLQIVLQSTWEGHPNVESQGVDQGLVYQDQDGLRGFDTYFSDG